MENCLQMKISAPSGASVFVLLETLQILINLQFKMCPFIAKILGIVQRVFQTSRLLFCRGWVEPGFRHIFRYMGNSIRYQAKIFRHQNKFIRYQVK